MLREARGGLKVVIGNRVKPDYHFIYIAFVLFCFVQPDSCVLFQAMLKACQYILEIVGLSQPKV